MTNGDLSPAYMYVQFRDNNGNPTKDVRVTADGKVRVRVLGQGKDFGSTPEILPESLSAHEKTAIEKMYDAWFGATYLNQKGTPTAFSLDPLD